MAEKFSEFGIDIGLSASGFDSVLSNFKHLYTEGQKIGKTTNEITEAMKRLKAAMEHALHVDSAKKMRELQSTTDSDRRRELSQEIANNNEKLAVLQEVWKKAQKGFGEGPSVFDSLQKSIKTLASGWFQLNQAIRPVKMMYHWVDAVAQLNMQLRMMHYSSGMAVASLKSYGAAASLYGGSANTVSSYAERHQTQLARARRGLGLGHFQEAAWQFGFRFDANESPEARFRRAIAHIGTLKKEDQLAFAQLEAPGRVKELMGYGRRKDGAKVYDELQAYSRSLQELTAENGKIISKDLSEKSEELADSQVRLTEQWNSIKDQFALSLLPTVKKFTDKIVGVMEWFNDLSPVKKNILMRGMQLVMGLVALIGAMGALRLVFTKLAQLLKYSFFLKGGSSGGAGGPGGASGRGGGLPIPSGAGGRFGGLGSLISLIPQSISAGADLATGMFTAQISNNTEFTLRVVQSIEQILFEHFAIAKAKPVSPEYIKVDTSEEIIGIKVSTDSLLETLNEMHVQMVKGVAIDEATTTLMAGAFARAIESHGGSTSGESSVVKNDNRTFNIEQHFVSSGDVRKDANDARDAMQERNMLDMSIN